MVLCLMEPQKRRNRISLGNIFGIEAVTGRLHKHKKSLQFSNDIRAARENDASSSANILKTRKCDSVDDLRRLNSSPIGHFSDSDVTNNNDYEKHDYREVRSATYPICRSDPTNTSRSRSPSTSAALSNNEIHAMFDDPISEADVRHLQDNDLSRESGNYRHSVSSNNSQSAHNMAMNESGYNSDNPIDLTHRSSLLDDDSLEVSLIEQMNPSSDILDLNMAREYGNQEEENRKSLEIGDILNPRPSFNTSLEGQTAIPLVQKVCQELLMTERSYINDLREIIEGYISCLKQQPDMEWEIIFGNLEDIYEFNKEVLYQIEKCQLSENEFDPVKVANVFVEKAQGFNSHYTQYCTNYPEAATFLLFIIQEDSAIAQFFVNRQASIGHVLPLQSYLLKPVQRILKYNLLLRDIVKKYKGHEDGRKTINRAVFDMSDVSEYINELMRLHENRIKVEEILSKVDFDVNEPIDIYATGRLVLEDTFKVHGVRGDREIYLFENLLLICKKTEDKQLQFKDKIECSNMMLVESIPKEPLAFLIMRFDNQKDTYTISAKNIEMKKKWTQHLKRLILESHKALIPQTARQAILGKEEQAKSKYMSLPIQALDDSGMNRNYKKQIPKSPNTRNSGNLSAGVKRESNEKDSSKEPKRYLNMKRDFLHDKKHRNINTSPTLGRASPEKEKKEKMRWIKRHKRKPSFDNDFLKMDTSPVSSRSEPISKSRSLESLKDSMKHEELIYEVNEEPGIMNCSFENEGKASSFGAATHERSDSANSSLPMPILLDRPKTLSDFYTEDDITYDDTINPSKIPSADLDSIRSECASPLVSIDSTFDSPRDGLTERWSGTDQDADERLENRLSILNDDDSSSSQIKNLVRKVSHAFSASFQPLTENEEKRSELSSSDLGELFYSPPSPISKYDHRRSTGAMPFLPKKIPVRTLSDINLYNDEDISAANRELNSTLFDTSAKVGTFEESADATWSAAGDILSDEDDTIWSANVDAVFDEVTADLDSIAGSITSDTANSNGGESDAINPTDSSTSIGIDVDKVEQIKEQTNDESETKSSELSISEKNIQNTSNNDDQIGSEDVVKSTASDVHVKQVADRIKEYKNSWKQREPRNINEMIESLDSIQSCDNALSPAYSSLRRRFRSSRDYGSKKDARSSIELTKLLEESFSENCNKEGYTPADRKRSEQREHQQFSLVSRCTVKEGVDNQSELILKSQDSSNLDVNENNQVRKSEAGDHHLLCKLINNRIKDNYLKGNTSKEIEVGELGGSQSPMLKTKPELNETEESENPSSTISHTIINHNDNYIQSESFNADTMGACASLSGLDLNELDSKPNSPNPEIKIQTTDDYLSCDSSNANDEMSVEPTSQTCCKANETTVNFSESVVCTSPLKLSLNDQEVIGKRTRVYKKTSGVNCEIENSSEEANCFVPGKYAIVTTERIEESKIDPLSSDDTTNLKMAPKDVEDKKSDKEYNENLEGFQLDEKIKNNREVIVEKGHNGDDNKENVSQRSISKNIFVYKVADTDNTRVIDRVKTPKKHSFEREKLKKFEICFDSPKNICETNSLMTSSANEKCRLQFQPRKAKSISLLALDNIEIPPANNFNGEKLLNTGKKSLQKSMSSPAERRKEGLRKCEEQASKKKAPNKCKRTPPPVAKKTTRSNSLPSTEGLSSGLSGLSMFFEKTKKSSDDGDKREQINQLKTNLDDCANDVDVATRGRSGETRHYRSMSLPRRKTNCFAVQKQALTEEKQADKYVLRSPSIRGIQQNCVNDRIKKYFVNMQKSSEISRSRPNLLCIGSGSDSESSNEENESISKLNDNNEDCVQIYRGTVRTMIKKYGQLNFVFD